MTAPASGRLTAQPRWRARIRIVVSRRRLITIGAAIAATAAAAIATIGLSLALFTAQAQAPALFGTKAIFPGERVSSAFQVGDSSSGSHVDTSSPFAFPADTLTTTTSQWSASFAPDRYVEFDLNNSLASGVAVSSPGFDFTFASSGVGVACYYLEVRRISTGAVLGAYGGAGTPLGCVTGSTLASFSTSIPALATTSVANDLRIRVYGRESTGGAMVIDRATVDGSTPYQGFTLYPVTFRDAADTSPETIPWRLQNP
jgi:hypothetical protein